MASKTAYIKGNRIVLTSAINSDGFAKLRTLTGVKWDSTIKQFTYPLTLQHYIALRRAGVSCSKDLMDWVLIQNITTHKQLNIPGLMGTLMPFQCEGVLKVNSFKHRALIADEMGLGKTVQGIAWAQMNQQIKPIIVVCPSMLKINWLNEIKKWSPASTAIILDSTTAYNPGEFDFYIINYDIIFYWVDMLQKLKAQGIIMDEMHYIKSAGTKQKPIKRTRALMTICKNIPNVVGLTGTPMDRPIELLIPLTIIKPHLFPSPWKYKHRYCGPKHNGFGWTFNGATNSEELHKILVDNVMIRRLKKDVLRDLPDKQYSFVPFSIDNKKEYDSAENDFIQYLKNTIDEKARKEVQTINSEYIKIDEEALEQLKNAKVSTATILGQIEILKQLAAQGILKDCIKWVEDFLESGEKLVLFGVHKSIIEILYKHFEKIAVKIDGSVSNTNRQKNVELFQNSKKIRLFLGNVQAAGVGITLTAASNVAFIEYPWATKELNQAVDRVHRIGQKNAVNAHFLTAKDTIHEKVIMMLHSKQKVADSVLDGKAQENTGMLNELINQFKNRLV